MGPTCDNWHGQLKIGWERSTTDYRWPNNHPVMIAGNSRSFKINLGSLLLPLILWVLWLTSPSKVFDVFFFIIIFGNKERYTKEKQVFYVLYINLREEFDTSQCLEDPKDFTSFVHSQKGGCGWWLIVGPFLVKSPNCCVVFLNAQVLSVLLNYVYRFTLMF